MRTSTLVVEDEPLIRMDTVMMLEEAGLDVVDFDNAAGAASYVEQHGRDVAALFTDVNLKGTMDGVELACRIAKTTPSVFLLVTSGYYADRPEALPPDIRFLKKPWLPLDVITALQNAVSAREEAYSARPTPLN